MTRLTPLFAAAALAGGLAACGNPQSAPEPENEATAEAMPATPDRSETAADEAAAGATAAAPAAAASQPPQPQPERDSGY